MPTCFYITYRMSNYSHVSKETLSCMSMCGIDQNCIAGICGIDLHVLRDRKCVSVCVPSLLESGIIFDTCVTVCMCMQCMYSWSILWDTTFSYMYLCTEWMYFNFSLLIKGFIADRGYKEYGHKDFDNKYLAA